LYFCQCGMIKSIKMKSSNITGVNLTYSLKALSQTDDLLKVKVFLAFDITESFVCFFVDLSFILNIDSFVN
jgi:hypothetical protein